MGKNGSNDRLYGVHIITEYMPPGLKEKIETLILMTSTTLKRFIDNPIREFKHQKQRFLDSTLFDKVFVTYGSIWSLSLFIFPKMFLNNAILGRVVSLIGFYVVANRTMEEIRYNETELIPKKRGFEAILGQQISLNEIRNPDNFSELINKKYELECKKEEREIRNKALNYSPDCYRLDSITDLDSKDSEALYLKYSGNSKYLRESILGMGHGG